MTKLSAKRDEMNLSALQSQPGQAVFVGTAGNDTYAGTSSDDAISGNDGNDFLSGSGGDDEILGNAGHDRLDGGDGNDQIWGGAGHDVITDTLGGGILSGDDGNDTIVGGAGNHSLSGGAGGDSLVGGDGDDSLEGGDTFNGDTSNDTLFGGTGNDLMITGGGGDSIDGGDGNDTLVWGRSDTVAGAYQGGDGTDTFRYMSGEISGTVSGFEILDGGNNEVRATTAFISGFTTVTGTRFLLTDGGSLNLSAIANGIQVTAAGGAATITTGAGNDSLIGGSGADTLDAGTGQDSVAGGDGNDLLISGSGADSFNAGSGDDTLVWDRDDTMAGVYDGGDGTDTFRYGAGDVLGTFSGFEILEGGDNEVRATTGFISSFATVTGTRFLLADGGSVNLSAIANGIQVTAAGGAAAITSGAGNDTLIGGSGADSLVGGAGDDAYHVGEGDTITEAEGSGTDTVFTALSYVLGDNLERLVQGGSDHLTATGNGLNNTIESNGGNNWLDGGAGADSLSGGLGHDTYVVENAADQATEAADAGSDTVFASVSYTLSAGIETLTLTGEASIDGTGNASANTLTGTAGNNRLDGAAGVDSLTGGLGDDTYVVDDLDLVVEAEASGTDTVLASVTYALVANVENLKLTGEANLDGTGNDLNNAITGNTGNNGLGGGAGADSLDGGAGVDTLTGGSGDDTFVADGADLIVEAEDGGADLVLASADHSLAAHVESLTLTGTANLNGTGNNLANTITGNTGNNSLDGGAGADTLAGGLGDDTYAVDDAGDIVVELGGSGIDTVIASVSYSLFARYAENLTLTGTDNLNAIGNSLRNVMSGNDGQNLIDAAAGNDWIDGGAGVDTLIGGLGDDTFVVDGADTVIEADGGGNDVVRASVSHSLAAHVESLVLTGAGDLNGTGNGLANTITGTAGNNALDGGAGADTLSGGLGNDTYTVDHAGDSVVEAGGEGADLIMASVSYSLVGRAVESLTLTGDANLTATGNSLSNTLTGNAGKNLLTGAAGNDVLDGGAGADSLTGGVGDDTYYVDNAGDKVNENHLEGSDTIISSVSYSLFGRAVEALVLTGTEHLTATGNSLANSLTGNAGNNALDGGIGADSLAGGGGDDTYTVDNTGDVVTEATGEGTDSIIASVTYSLAGRSVEALTLTGSANLNGTGNSLKNVLTGNAGNNQLTGAAGDDLLNGGAGADSLYGGVGNDTFYVDNAGDKVYENHLEGSDTIISSVSYSLFGRAVEALVLTGAEHLTATGNGLVNSLTGNAGNNWLDGAAGADNLAGGAGDDTYVVDDAGDKVAELTGEGADLILASVSYSLAGRVVEALTLTGAANINATGNSLANLLTGNSGVNKLDGGAGHDRLDGGAGADSLYGGLGDDTFYVDDAGDKVYENHFEGHDLIIASVSYSLFGRAVDDLVLTGTDHLTVTGNSLNNSLTGNAGNNVLDGGIGADTLAGGLGDDTYYVDYSGDLVVETGASGTDTIFASVSYSLAGRTVESLILTGTAHINATGNGLANSLTGNDGKNRLDGGAGNDSLTGGLGADVFVFFSGKDTVTDFTASQNDSIDVHAYTGGVANAGLVTQVGADVVIALGAGSVTVLNATQADVLAHMVW